MAHPCPRSPCVDLRAMVDNNDRRGKLLTRPRHGSLLSTSWKKNVLDLAFVCILILTIHNKASAQTMSVDVVNSGWLPIAVQIVDTLCNNTIYQGNIVGNARVTTRA